MNSIESAINKMAGSDTEARKLGRCVTTLFMLISADGKISSGVGENRDFDCDLNLFEETSAGLQQYYDIEKTTDEWTLCTGRTKNKIGINNDCGDIERVSAKLVIIDNRYLTDIGVSNLIRQYEWVVLFTENRDHPAFNMEEDMTIYLCDTVDTADVLRVMYHQHGVERLTVQTGSMTNGDLIQSHLIDYIDFVIAPLIVGGNKVPSVVGTADYGRVDSLDHLALMKLEKCEVLNDSYVRLRYKVNNSV